MELSKAFDCFEEALKIRQMQIGSGSLESAKVLEEIGKVKLEQLHLTESFEAFKECYQVYMKHNYEGAERIATLMCFLHRKIEQKLVKNDFDNKQAARIQTLLDKTMIDF